MATGWVTGWISEAWSQDGFLRHGRWVTGWVSEAWPLGGSQDGFLRDGHRVGFRHMATVGHWMGF